MNISTKFHDNPSNSYWYISVRTKVVDRPTVMLLAPLLLLPKPSWNSSDSTSIWLRLAVINHCKQTNGFHLKDGAFSWSHRLYWLHTEKKPTYKSHPQFVCTDLLRFVSFCTAHEQFHSGIYQCLSGNMKTVKRRKLISHKCWRGVKIIIRQERDREEEWLEWQL